MSKKYKKLEEEIEQTKINAKNEKLNFISKNPQATGGLILGIVACILIFFSPGAIIFMIFGARRLLKAKRIGENQSYINIGQVIVYLPVFILIITFYLYMQNHINQFPPISP